MATRLEVSTVMDQWMTLTGLPKELLKQELIPIVKDMGYQNLEEVSLEDLRSVLLQYLNIVQKEVDHLR